MSKITLELGGKYTAGEMINRAQADTKKFGQTTKDIGNIGVQSFNALASSIDGPASTALKGFSSALTGLATGGMFGVVASVANVAFGLIGDYINDCIKKAEQFRELLVTGVTGGINTIASKSAEIYKKFAEGNKDGNTSAARKIEANNTSQRKYEADVDLGTQDELKSAKLESEKKLIIAEGEYLKATERAKTELENATTKRIALYDQHEAALNTITELEGQHAELKTAENNFLIENGGILQREKELKTKANQTVEELIAQGYSSYKAQQILAKRNQELADFQAENKTVIETGAAIQKRLQESEETLARAKQDEADLSHKMEIAGEDVRTAQTRLAAVTEQHTAALDGAKMAVEAEKAALEKKAEQDALAEEIEKERNQWKAHIYKGVKASEKEYEKLIKVANQGIEDGLEQAEIEASLREEWNRILADRNEAGKKETELIGNDNKGHEGNKGGNGNGGNGNKLQDKLAKLEATKGLGITGEDAHKGDIDYKPSGSGGPVSLDQNSINAIGTSVERGGSFKDALKAVREGQRKVRDAQNNIKIDQPKMVKFMKGQMSEPERKAFEQYLQTKYTPGQIDYLKEHALKSQLLSKSDAEKQKRAVEEIKDKIKQAIELK